LRAQAETALRKAIQLDPNYGPGAQQSGGDLHQPVAALGELARWHYQKALDAGQPHNPDLEKMLDAERRAGQSRNNHSITFHFECCARLSTN